MEAIELRLEQDEECHRLTLEALSDVSAGNVISYQAVAEWAHRLGSEQSITKIWM